MKSCILILKEMIRQKIMALVTIGLMLYSGITFAHCCPGSGCPIVSDLNATQMQYLLKVRSMLADVPFTHPVTCERVFSSINLATSSAYRDLNGKNVRLLQREWKVVHSKYPHISNENAFIYIGNYAFSQKIYYMARFCYRFAMFSSKAAPLLMKANYKIANVEYEKVCSKGWVGCHKK